MLWRGTFKFFTSENQWFSSTAFLDLVPIVSISIKAPASFSSVLFHMLSSAPSFSSQFSLLVAPFKYGHSIGIGLHLSSDKISFQARPYISNGMGSVYLLLFIRIHPDTYWPAVCCFFIDVDLYTVAIGSFISKMVRVCAILTRNVLITASKYTTSIVEIGTIGYS